MKRHKLITPKRDWFDCDEDYFSALLDHMGKTADDLRQTSHSLLWILLALVAFLASAAAVMAGYQ